MTRRTEGKSEDLLSYDPEIERTAKSNNIQRRKQQREMADNVGNNGGEHNANNQNNNDAAVIVRDNQPQTLGDLQLPIINGNPSCIRLSPAAWSYELKHGQIALLPTFSGSITEDAVIFIREFYHALASLPRQNLIEDEIRMRCFAHCLKGSAKTCFLSLEIDSFGTWQEVYAAFILKYYPAYKSDELRAKIQNFEQEEDETFYKAWERFRELITQCPHHGYSQKMLYYFFYKGLTENYQNFVDNAAGGGVDDKTPEFMKEVYERLARKSQQKKSRGKSKASVELATKVDNLSKQMKQLLNQQSGNREACFQCGMYGHRPEFCMNVFPNSDYAETVNYMGAYGSQQQSKNDPFSNTYNPGLRNNPNFSWSNQRATAPRPMGPSGFQQPRPHPQQIQPKQEQGMEVMLQKFMTVMDNKLDSKFEVMDTKFEKMEQLGAHVNKLDRLVESHSSSIKNIEVQLGHIANAIGGRSQGTLPSNTEVNPMESVMAITLRNGKTIEELPRKEKEAKRDENPASMEVEKVKRSSVENKDNARPDSGRESTGARSKENHNSKISREPTSPLFMVKSHWLHLITLPLAPFMRG